MWGTIAIIYVFGLITPIGYVAYEWLEEKKPVTASKAFLVTFWPLGGLWLFVLGALAFWRENRRRLHAARAKADPPPQTGVYR